MAAVALASPGQPVSTRSRAKRREYHWPVENFLVFALAAAFYIVVANYFVFHMHYMIGDAYARIDNAFDVLFTSDPHLAGIGFFWPPLPSFLDLPIIAFKPLWPGLVTQGFAGSIEAALFSAGTVVLFHVGLKWAGVIRPMRWLFCLVWAVNPMTVIYASQGMSEAMFVFFFVATILVFLIWSESRRSALLPLLGVVAGLGCLCRNESFVLAFFVGAGVVVQSIRNRASWREIETEALLYALPAVFVMMLWIGSMGVIEHDPLYWIHQNLGGTTSVATTGPPVAQPNSDVRAKAFGLVSYDLRTGARYVLTRSVALFPAVVAFLAMLGARLLIMPRRVPGILLIICGACIPALDVYLLRGGLGPDLRYQISVIPFTFLIAVYVLRSLRRRTRLLSTLVAAGMVVALAASVALSVQTLSNYDLAPQEAPLINALGQGQRLPVTAGFSPMDLGADLAPHILALDRDHGRILCDSSTCFPIILNAPDAAKQFVVTSDEVFQAAAGQPQVYGVEYFLVPTPTGQGALDALNVLYPGLYDTGDGFAQLVGYYGGFKLYRITGPTGRGG